MDNDILSLEEIKKIVFDTAKIINAHSLFLPTFGTIEGSASPAIKVDNYGYHYIISERGEEYEHKITFNIKDLLYLVFRHVTFSMANDYELKNRIEKQDYRRIAFDKQIELMNKIDSDFGAKLKLEIEEILKNYPYDDFASVRTSLYKKYQTKGIPDTEAWEMACKEYPLPSN